jgi:hypothetical protein
VLLLLLSTTFTTWAQSSQAEVEVRVPQPPQVVEGSDGLPHLAYELHITNFYQSTGTLDLQAKARPRSSHSRPRSFPPCWPTPCKAAIQP